MDRTFRGGTGADDFQLSVLMKAHSAYTSLKEQFFTKWQKPANGLTVERIFKVQVRVKGQFLYKCHMIVRRRDRFRDRSRDRFRVRNMRWFLIITEDVLLFYNPFITTPPLNSRRKQSPEK